MILPLLLILAVQSDKLPPANPLPYTDPEAAGVMAPVNRLLAAVGTRDAAVVAAETRPEGGATVVVERDGAARTIRHLAWAEFAAGMKPGKERFEERMADTAIEVDGDIAMVWGPYVFLIDGKPHHCGVNHFDLIRESGRWKILNVTWSQRTTGCEAAR